MNYSETLSFIIVVWNIFFQEHMVAPKTLCFDPVSSFSEIYTGLSHIAYRYYPDNLLHDPDDQIFIISNLATYYVRSNDSVNINISELPQLECIIFVSNDNYANVQQVLDKLDTKSVVIVMNECVELPKDWIFQDIKIFTKRKIPSPKEMGLYIRI